MSKPNLFTPRALRGPGLLVALFGMAIGPQAMASDAAIVGETSMVIGVVKLHATNGSARDVVRGMPIRVGDRIETDIGGHVHVRFVDGGRLSVRPASRLQIENYAYSSQDASSAAIKFKLEEGVVRSITGSWGESARNRFRLNTPVAAIGIKGTDFVVKSDAEKTSAAVYAGAITLAPLSEACMTTVGPCVNGFEKLLSQEMKGQMLELSKRQTAPQLVPAVDLLASSQPARSGPVVAAVTTVVPAAEPAAGAAIVSESRAADVVARATEMPPIPGVPTGPAQAKQLAWTYVGGSGFLGGLPKPDGDTLSQNFEDATRNNATIVGGTFGYQLYRVNQPQQNTLVTANTVVDFRLSGAFAYLETPSNNRGPATVHNGQLQVDFSKATFATSLDLSSPTIGADKLTVQGAINPADGRFLPADPRALSGALTLDGTEAGYLFEKNYGRSGTLRGITLWGR